MSGGYYSVSLYGQSGGNVVNNKFINCNFIDYHQYGFYNQYGTGTIVRNCIVERPTRPTLSTSGGYGIVLTTGSTNCLVDGNRVRRLYGAVPVNTTTTYCLYNIV